MDVFDAVRTVLAVRAFQDKAVPEAVKEQIIEAGRLTGSGGNVQPWHFIVIDDREALRKMAEAAKSGPYIAEAAFAIAVAVEPGNLGLSDGSRAIQSMILTAWSVGVGSNWVGFSPMPAVSLLLDVPDTLNVLAVIPFGYPVKTIGQGKKKRKPASEVVHRGKFGQSS